MRPFTTTDEAWAALAEQRGMSDGEAVDLWEHQLQTRLRQLSLELAERIAYGNAEALFPR